MVSVVSRVLYSVFYGVMVGALAIAPLKVYPGAAFAQGSGSSGGRSVNFDLPIANVSCRVYSDKTVASRLELAGTINGTPVVSSVLFVYDFRNAPSDPGALPAFFEKNRETLVEVRPGDQGFSTSATVVFEDLVDFGTAPPSPVAGQLFDRFFDAQTRCFQRALTPPTMSAATQGDTGSPAPQLALPAEQQALVQEDKQSSPAVAQMGRDRTPFFERGPEILPDDPPWKQTLKGIVRSKWFRGLLVLLQGLSWLLNGLQFIMSCGCCAGLDIELCEPGVDTCGQCKYDILMFLLMAVPGGWVISLILDLLEGMCAFFTPTECCQVCNHLGLQGSIPHCSGCNSHSL